jgi:uncharacterized membrane protein
LPILKWPIIQLGLPAIMLMRASFFLRKQKDDQLVWYLEVGSIGLFALSAFYFSRHLLHPTESIFLANLTFLERVFATNVALFCAGICFWLNNKTSRSAYLFCAKIIYGFAFLRIIFLHLLFYNPLLSHENVGSIFLINNLALAYFTPLLMIYFINNKLHHSLKYSNFLSMILLFAFISLNVRWFYHGEYLDGNITSNSEIYTYSASWLLLGIGLLIYGTLKNHKPIRIASLIVMIISIGKVFLYDASALSGLYRIFSFLGLGVILLGLSYFYSIFVFKEHNDDDKLRSN